MSTKLFLITLTAFFGLSQFANAGVKLYVSFGENAPSIVNNEDALQKTFNPGGSSVTANIYLHLTNNSAMYGYRFSVRYNALALGLTIDTPAALADFQSLQDGVRQDLRDEFGANIFAEEFPFTDPFGPPVSPSAVIDPLTNGDFLEIRRFNGYMNSGEVIDDRFFKVATITFNVLNSALLTPNTQLVQPGKFDFKPANVFPFSPNDVNLDEFLGVNSNNDPIVLDFLGASGGSVTGGSVTGVASVPEPTSAIVLGLIGVFALSRRKLRAK